jgi:hypothetical protein
MKQKQKQKHLVKCEGIVNEDGVGGGGRGRGGIRIGGVGGERDAEAGGRRWLLRCVGGGEGVAVIGPIRFRIRIRRKGEDRL